MTCINCAQPLNGPYRGFWFECPACGLMRSNLRPAIGDAQAHQLLDEEARDRGLRILRRTNADSMLKVLSSLTETRNPKLLDIGCGHGWFMEEAVRLGCDALGIEPDSLIAAGASRRGLNVVHGFFPAAVPAGKQFDIIVFNDVLEHLEDVPAALEACKACLKPAGLLAVTLPNSKGIIFRISRALDRVGIRGPLDRLWQRGFPSPHVSYFHPDALAGLFGRLQLQEVHRGRLLTVTREGLWQRIRYERAASLLACGIQYGLISASMPLLRILPPDISFQVFTPG